MTNKEKIQELEQTIKLLVILLSKVTRPNNCYVGSWYVHEEYREIIERLRIENKV